MDNLSKQIYNNISEIKMNFLCLWRLFQPRKNYGGREIKASVNFQRHSKDIQEQTFVETFNFFPTPVACLVSFSCFYIPMNTINNENSTLITVSPDIQILPRHSYFARTFGFYLIWMSARTFKSCPDIRVFIESECLPGHSNFARTFGFI